MLNLSRYPGERICVGNDIVIEIKRIVGGRVVIGIDAPPKVMVMREEKLHEELVTSKANTPCPSQPCPSQPCLSEPCPSQQSLVVLGSKRVGRTPGSRRARGRSPGDSRRESIHDQRRAIRESMRDWARSVLQPTG